MFNRLGRGRVAFVTVRRILMHSSVVVTTEGLPLGLVVRIRVRAISAAFGPSALLITDNLCLPRDALWLVTAPARFLLGELE
jgi:hypothetical protein